jgi:hypothetical protein
MKYAVRYDYHCGSPFSDKEVTLLTTDASDPLDWIILLHFSIIKRMRLHSWIRAYSTIIDYHHDWQAVELTVVEV